MSNIFKNAYFGKPYKTRDEREAIFSHIVDDKVYLMYPHPYINDESTYLNYGYVDMSGYCYNKSHPCEDDIVSEWQESINEEKLDGFANEYYYSLERDPGIRPIFKAGYRKGWKDKK